MLFRSSAALLFKRAATSRPMVAAHQSVTSAVKTVRPSVAMIPTMIDRSVDRYHQPNHRAVSASDCEFKVMASVPSFCIPTCKKEAFAAVGPADFEGFAMEGTRNYLLQISKDEKTCASKGKKEANHPKGDSVRIQKPVVGIKAMVPLNSATEVGNHDDPSHDAAGDHYSIRSSKLMTAPRAIPFRSANTWDPLAVHQASPVSKIQEGQQERMFSTGPSDSPPEPKRSGTGVKKNPNSYTKTPDLQSRVGKKLSDLIFSGEDCADMACAALLLFFLEVRGLAWAYYFLFVLSMIPGIETPSIYAFSLLLIACGAPRLAMIHTCWYCL